MRLLITGAFGNIGKAVMSDALDRGHEITVFEVDNEKTRKDAAKYRGEIKEVLFGDIRSPSDIQNAVRECDAVIHLAAIIPPASKKSRKFTMAVNYTGTVNLINAINESHRRIALVFTSSASVMGPTQDQDRVVERDDPLVVTGFYEESKIKCEEALREESDDYLIFRLAGVLPSFSGFSPVQAVSFIEEIFDMHPDMRLEMITDSDVATALVTGAEKLVSESTMKNQAYILAGGEKNGWRFTGMDFFPDYSPYILLNLPEGSVSRLTSMHIILTGMIQLSLRESSSTRTLLVMSILSTL